MCHVVEVAAARTLTVTLLVHPRRVLLATLVEDRMVLYTHESNNHQIKQYLDLLCKSLKFSVPPSASTVIHSLLAAFYQITVK